MRKFFTAGLAAGLVSAVIAAVVAATAPAAAAPADTVVTSPDLYVLTTDGQLRRYGQTNNNPFALEKSAFVKGLAGNERLVALDSRPYEGRLYGLTSRGRLVTVTPNGATSVVTPQSNTANQTSRRTALAAAVSSPGATVGFDFSADGQTIRVSTASGVNTRLDPDDGSLTGSGGNLDTALSYAPADPFFGTAPQVAALAVANDDFTSVVYGIDSARDTLVVPNQNNPGNGRLSTVVGLQVDVSAINGFDIAGTSPGPGFDPADYDAVFSTSISALSSAIFSLDLSDGSVVGLGNVSGQVVGLTYAIRPLPV